MHGQEEYSRGEVPFSVYHIWAYMVLIRSDVNLGHLALGLSANIPHNKHIIFPVIVAKCPVSG